MAKQKEYQTCPTCNGTGSIEKSKSTSKDCPTCGGLGVVEKK